MSIELHPRAVHSEADEVVLPRQPVVVVEVDGAAVRRRRPLPAGLVGPVGRTSLISLAVYRAGIKSGPRLREVFRLVEAEQMQN